MNKEGLQGMSTSTENQTVLASVHQLHQALPAERQANADKRERLLRLSEVEARTGLRKSAIYAGMRASPATFPRCILITARCVAWPESRIEQWIADRLAAAERKS